MFLSLKDENISFAIAVWRSNLKGKMLKLHLYVPEKILWIAGMCCAWCNGIVKFSSKPCVITGGYYLETNQLRLPGKKTEGLVWCTIFIVTNTLVGGLVAINLAFSH